MPICAIALLSGCTSSPVILPERAIVLPDRPPKQAQPENATNNQEQLTNASPEAIPVVVVDPAEFDLTYSIFSDPKQNPDINGRPSPLQIRLYQLEHDGVFESADFLTLYKNDKQLLNHSLLEWKTFMLYPGETRIAETRDMSRDAKYFAVLAAFQDHETLYTKQIVDLDPKRPQSICIYIRPDGLRVANISPAVSCPPNETQN